MLGLLCISHIVILENFFGGLQVKKPGVSLSIEETASELCVNAPEKMRGWNQPMDKQGHSWHRKLETASQHMTFPADGLHSCGKSFPHENRCRSKQALIAKMDSAQDQSPV